MYTPLCDNLLTYVSFYFIVSVTETAKTASMASTNSNCIQLHDARTQNSQNNFVECHEQTMQITQSYLVFLLCLLLLLVRFADSLSIWTITAENKIGESEWKTLRLISGSKVKGDNDEDIVCGNSTYFHVLLAAYVRARNTGLSQS